MAKIEILDSHVRLLLSKQYGKSSEKIDSSQLNLFGNATDDDQSEIENQLIPEHTRTKKKKKSKTEGRPAFPDHLPRNEIHCELSGDDLICPTCETTLNEIGVDMCEAGHFEPAKFTVNQIHKHKYACPNGHLVATADAPEGHLARCKYDSSVHAAVVTSRFGDHLPYYRQEAIFKRLGVSIPRQSMGDMAQKVAAIAALILKQMLKELIAEKVLFDFSMSRSSASPNRILKFFFGILQVDGWGAYNKITKTNQLGRAGCWAHVRRKFVDCFKISKEVDSAKIIGLIGKLYRIEAALKKRRGHLSLCDDDFFALRLTVRGRRSRPVTKQIHELLLDYKSDSSFLPKSLLGKAVNYALKQWQTMETYLDHGDVEIDNNRAERAMRPVAIGRKNWLVVGNEKGGRTAAALYSLVESCKAIDVNPQAYLEDVIGKAQHTDEDKMYTLTPWAWKASQAQD